MTETIARAIEIVGRVHDNAGGVVLGKSAQIKLVLSALICKGHVLLEDVPGTAKTMLARSLAGSIEGAVSNRIQCTPDLQPTDVTGLSVWDPERRRFEFQPGPVFANVLLVDEVNRALPKAQSALLEAMAERQVTVDGVTQPAAATVPAHGNGEHDRAGGDVPAARGSTRPLSHPHLARLPDAGRGAARLWTRSFTGIRSRPSDPSSDSRTWTSSSRRWRRSTSIPC